MPAPPTDHPLSRLPEEWGALMNSIGERPFRAREVFRWIHHRGAASPDEMTTLPAKLRQRLQEEWTAPVTVERVHRSDDGTRKVLLRLADDSPIETVLLPSVSGPGSKAESDGAAGLADADAAAAVDDEDEDSPSGASSDVAPRRVTQCISTQVGCAMGCVFCASGVAGLKRHLSAAEVIGQVLIGRSLLEPGEQLRNVVFMGMGEPLNNYEATKKSLQLMTHPDGIDLSKRRVTVSTSGLIPEIARLGEDFDGQIGLAISLHAADDTTRSALMPINKKYPLAKLMEALRAYPLPKRRRITIEYTLVSGKNDDIQEAQRVARLLRGLPVKINLIPMNPIEAATLGPPNLEGVLAFQQVLTQAGYSCFIRRRRGDDVSAACGQLALLGAKPKVKSFRNR